jgi:transposase
MNNFATIMGAIFFDQLVSVGCGIDVHKDLIVATIRSSNTTYETKEFTSYTSSLKQLREWCKSNGVSHVAMESTGVYWKPVFNVLESDFEILLVNARHVKNVPGHKTDKKDSIWLSKLLLSGLLKGSFIPNEQIRDLRDLVRYRKKVVGEVSREKNRTIKILEDCNIKLSSVLSNVDGSTGTKVIKDIIAGITDAEQLKRHYHRKMKASKEDFALALEGKVRPHHQTMLAIIQESISSKEAIIERIDKEIDKLAETYSVEIAHLETIPGVGRDSAIAIISEIGTDMSVFPNEHHLASWSGVSPGNNESGGKKKAVKPLKVINTSKPPSLNVLGGQQG